MSTVGRIEEFNPDNEEIGNYLFRLKHYLLVNKIADTRRVSVLVTVLGGKIVSLLRDLVSPEQVDAKTYEELVELLEKHFQPRKLVVAERYAFYQRYQKSEESISEYIVSLKHLSSTCKFGDFLNDALRDRLISGLHKEEMRNQLIVEELSFTQAVEKALRLEQVEKQGSLFQNQVKPSDNSGNVNLVKRVERMKVRQNPGSTRAARYEYTGVQKNEQNAKVICWRCNGEGHLQRFCAYKSYECHKCKKVGHLARACQKKMINFNSVTEEGIEDESDQGMFGIMAAEEKSAKDNKKKSRGWVEIKMQGRPLKMLVDTGACMSIIPDHIYNERQELKQLPIEQVGIKLNTYVGERVEVKGKIMVKVQYLQQQVVLPLIVVQGTSPGSPALLGRNWLATLNLEWGSIFSMHQPHTSIEYSEKVKSKIERITSKFATVFKPGIGEIKGKQVAINVKEGAVPKFCKAHPIPFAIKGAVDKELDNLVRNKVLYRVSHSEWATPLVIVPKPNKGIRICADFKITANPVIDQTHYPLPTTEEMFATLAGGKVFTVIDLASAYQQLAVRKECQEILTVNTHRGLYRYRRLPFGISSGPALFQAVMDEVLKGLPGVVCYLDDVLCASENVEEGVKQIEQVLQRLQDNGIQVRGDKCQFLRKEVKYLGYSINEEGIWPTESLVKAIQEAPEPQNIQELRAYLGLLNFYGKFISELSTKLHKLYELLRNVPWSWTIEHSKIFEDSKKWLLSYPVLVHYDAQKPITLTCDASPVGVGCILSHIMEGGEEKPIAFASKTLTPAEKNYSQLEREALGIIFGVKKFHKYLYGRRFVLYTDHKPLTTIFGEKQGIPTLAAARLQRWALILAAYNYEIRHKAGSEIANVDALSRLPVKSLETVEQTNNYFSPCEELIGYFSPVLEMPIRAKDIAEATKQDVQMSQVMDFVMTGWPNQVKENLRPYLMRRLEMAVDNGCLTWGTRVIIPTKLREAMLQLLHEGHPGTTRMKMLGRSFMWWPKMDEEIAEMVRSCDVCQAVQNSVQKVPLQSWPEPARRWQRVHIDYAKDTSEQLVTTSSGHYILCVIDSFSKWMEMFLMTRTTTDATIEKLRTLFAAFGLPELVVSDNGPQFTSEEFRQFLRQNGVEHMLTPPYHPASNGAAEKSVQTVKKALLKQALVDLKVGSIRTMQHKLDNFLFAYRTTPSVSTGKSPAELFLQRQLRTRITLIKPNLAEEMDKRYEEKTNREKGKKRQFITGERVWVRNVKNEKVNWTQGVIIKKISEVTYQVQIQKVVRYCHADHLKKNYCEERPETQETEGVTDKGDGDKEDYGEASTRKRTRKIVSRETHSDNESEEKEQVGVRRSERERRTPNKMDI